MGETLDPELTFESSIGNCVIQSLANTVNVSTIEGDVKIACGRCGLRRVIEGNDLVTDLDLAPIDASPSGDECPKFIKDPSRM